MEEKAPPANQDVSNSQNLPLLKRLPVKHITIGVLLLLIGLGGGWYLRSMNIQKTAEIPPQKEQDQEVIEDEGMSGWKTFISDYNDVSFKYPPNYQTEDRINYLSILSPIDRSKEKIGRPIDSDELKVEVVVFDSAPNDSLSKWREELQKETSGTITDLGITTIDGVETQVLIGVGISTTKIHLMIYEGKRYMIIKYPFSTTRDLEFDQILSTFEFINTKTDIQTTSSIIIPDNWQVYNKRFADGSFYFRYPPEYEISDNDPDSGDIYLSKIGTHNYPIYLSINTISNSGWQFEPYQSGSRRVWFKENLAKNLPSYDLSTLSFQEVNLENEKSYLFVSGFPKDSGWNNQYIGIQNGIAVKIGHPGIMSQDEVFKILSTLNVVK